MTESEEMAYFDSLTDKDGRCRTRERYAKWLSENKAATVHQRECIHCFNGYSCKKHKINNGGCADFLLRDGTKPNLVAA